jgi:hypothetical protein
MLIRLNVEAIKQLEALMVRTGNSNHQHCLQVLISTVTNNLRRNDEKASKKAA